MIVFLIVISVGDVSIYRTAKSGYHPCVMGDVDVAGNHCLVRDGIRIEVVPRGCAPVSEEMKMRAMATFTSTYIDLALGIATSIPPLSARYLLPRRRVD